MVDVGILNVPIASPDADVPLALSPRDGGPDVGVVYTWGDPTTALRRPILKAFTVSRNFARASEQLQQCREMAAFITHPSTCVTLANLAYATCQHFLYRPGDGFFAAVGKDQRLYTWGVGDQGQLGLGHTRGSVVPECVSSKGRFVQVACGKEHSVALDNKGKCIYVWTGIRGPDWARPFEGAHLEDATAHCSAAISKVRQSTLGVQSYSSGVRTQV